MQQRSARCSNCCTSSNCSLLVAKDRRCRIAGNVTVWSTVSTAIFWLLSPTGCLARDWDQLWPLQSMIVSIVSLEISGGKFLEIYSNLCGNFRNFIKYPCQLAASKSSIAKCCCKMCMFLTNNSPDPYALTLCIVFRKKWLVLARLPGISGNSNENYRHYNLQAFADVSENFRRHWISGKFTILVIVG